MENFHAVTFILARENQSEFCHTSHTLGTNNHNCYFMLLFFHLAPHKSQIGAFSSNRKTHLTSVTLPLLSTALLVISCHSLVFFEPSFYFRVNFCHFRVKNSARKNLIKITNLRRGHPCFQRFIKATTRQNCSFRRTHQKITLTISKYLTDFSKLRISHEITKIRIFEGHFRSEFERKK